MRQPSTPTGNNGTQRARSRGAIRTHLGRKRTGPRTRALRGDLPQRDDPTLTLRSGDITSAGTLTCAGCGWTIQTTHTTVLPPCPHCSATAFRKTG